MLRCCSRPQKGLFPPLRCKSHSCFSCISGLAFPATPHQCPMMQNTCFQSALQVAPLFPRWNLVSRTNQLATRGKTKEKMSAHLPIRTEILRRCPRWKIISTSRLDQIVRRQCHSMQKVEAKPHVGGRSGRKKARNDPVTLKHCCNYSVRMDVLLVVANDGVFADHDYRLCRQLHQRVIFDHASRKRAFFSCL